MLEYPTSSRQDVLHVCDPWIDQDRCEPAMSAAGLLTTWAGFYEGCDLASHSGFVKAQEILLKTKFRWVVVHVPRGPGSLFPEECNGDRRAEARARRCLRLVRHLLMLSQQGLQQGSKLIWVVRAQSKVMSMSEVRSFWHVHGHGQTCAWQGDVRYLVTDATIRNTLSTTTSRGSQKGKAK